MKYLTLFLILLLSLLPVNSIALEAFPGAVGVGKDTLGGRGGTVIKVTNLNANGAGSFRAAVEASGPRYVIFEVSGVINLDDALLQITNPYLTIAGETSPGGVSTAGHQINIATHDVIIRHTRFRAGSHTYDTDGINPDTDGDSLDILGANWNGGTPVYNIIIDHCSFSYGVDETMSVTGGALTTTISYCLFGAALDLAKTGFTHGKGLLVSGKYNEDTEVSMYRNAFITNPDRNPEIFQPYDGEGGSQDNPSNTTYIVEGVNNVIYNWNSSQYTSIWHAARANWIQNFNKQGPESNAGRDYFMQYYEAGGQPKILYVSGNVGAEIDNTPISFSGWGVSDEFQDVDATTNIQQVTPWNIDISLPQTTMTVSLASEIVATVGATVPERDSLDTSLATDFTNGTGSFVNDVTYPDDWPTYPQNAVPTDSDDDGMGDEWEVAEFGDLSETATGDFYEDGYDNIENYFQFLITEAGGEDTTPPIISAPIPTEDQACTTDPRTVAIGVTTNENATCKWHTTDVAYASMANTFDGTGTTTHTDTSGALACDNSYIRYVRCQDDEGTPNVNESSTLIEFSIAAESLGIINTGISLGSATINLGSAELVLPN